MQNLLSKPVNSKSNDTLATVFCAHYDVKPQGNVNPLQVGKKVVEWKYRCCVLVLKNVTIYWMTSILTDWGCDKIKNKQNDDVLLGWMITSLLEGTLFLESVGYVVR